MLTAAGNIQLNAISASGSSGWAGGNVTVQTLGAAAANITTGSIYADGGSGAAALISLDNVAAFSSKPDGGNAGNVSVTANNGDITITNVSARGGGGAGGSTAGGNGGTVLLTRKLGPLTFSSYNVDASGGPGGSPGPGRSGDGGTIRIIADSGALTVVPMDGLTLDASGAPGGDPGGNGGLVELRSNGGALSAPGVTVRAHGGAGRAGSASGSTGGAGGNGGVITIAALGGAAVDLSGVFSAAGGVGGDAGTCAAPCPAPVSGGAGGSGGSITLGNRAGTTGLVFGLYGAGLDLSAGSSGKDSAGVAGTTAPAGAVLVAAASAGVTQVGAVTSTFVASPPNLNFDSAGPVTLMNAGNDLRLLSGNAGGNLSVLHGRGTAGLTAGGSMDLTGKSAVLFTIENSLASTGNMTVTGTGADISIAAGASVSAPAIGLNAPTVLLAGSLRPGGPGAVGTATISGNLQVNTGGVLEFDFNGPTARDTLSVTGVTTFGVGTTVVANATSQPPNGTYVLIAGAAGGTLPTLSGTIASASLAFKSLDLIVAAPTPPPTVAPTPPPTVAPAPAPTAAPAPAPTAAPAPAPTAAPTPAPTAAPTPAPTPAPAPAPTPAPTPPPPPPSPAPPPVPAPAPLSAIDQIVALLRDETSREVVQAVLAEQQGLVPQFMELLLKEEDRQRSKGKHAITITDTQCKP